MPKETPDRRVRVQRHPERGAYDRNTISTILDEGLVCHVGFIHDGRPVVIPTLHARDGDRIYLHGSPASRMLGTLAGGVDLCLTVTLVDALVFARSAFHHSVNYRSVVVFGKARRVDEAAEKLRALEAITEQVAPGRWADVRPPDARELDATTVLTVSLDEASAKVRSGPAIDDPRDRELDAWAGVLPLQLRAGTPEPGADVPSKVSVPSYLLDYRRHAG